MYNSLMDLDSHRQELAKRLTTLESAIAHLVDALAHGNFCAQVEGSTTDRGAIRKVCDAYSTIDYEMDDDVNQSPVCLGLVGVNADTLKKAQAVNTAKAQFKALCTPLQGIRIRIPVKGETPTKAIPAIRVILRNIQRSDLNLLAAYRKIPILERPPATVTYTRANTRAVYRKTVEEIAAMLENLDSPAALADRETLGNLDRRVTHLALVKDRYPNVRANILYSRLDPKGRGRIQISAELPLIYATGRHHEPPHVHWPGPDDSTERKRARASKLEPAPLLNSLPVYRYRIR
jgi:hypothetical protein